MASGAPGQGGRLNQATISLRLALLHADEDSDRLRALVELARGTVFAATWPSSPEAVRTLANSDGEQAMPLFSGLDTLQSAAQRFGWMNPDGSFAFRELPAREALQSAIEQGVHYVVLDIYADHAAEFAQHEIRQVLQQVRAPAKAATRTQVDAQAARVQRTPGSGQAGDSSRRASPLLAEIDLPFGKERESCGRPAARAPLQGPAAPRTPDAQRVDARPQPAAAGMPPATRAEVVRAPSTLREQPAPSSERAARPGSAALAAAPESQLALPPSLPAAPAAANGPALDALPAIESLQDPFPTASASPIGAATALRGFAEQQPELEARPAALEAAAMVAQVGKLAGGDAETQKAAAELAAMLTDMARTGVSEEAQPATAQSAAQALAGMLSSELAADTRRGKRGRRAQAHAGPTAEAEAEPEVAQADAAESSAAEAAAEGALRGLEVPIEDAALDGMADALRKYPEVEWACAVSDGSALPAVALRIDPAFTARASEIESALIDAAHSRGTALSVLLLNDPQQLRDARTHGNAFFPWRKRAPKR